MLQEISFLSSVNTGHCFTALFTGLSYFLLNQLRRRKGTEESKHNTCTFFHHKECIKQKIPATDGSEVVWGSDSELSVLGRAILMKPELFLCAAQT